MSGARLAPFISPFSWLNNPCSGHLCKYLLLVEFLTQEFLKQQSSAESAHVHGKLLEHPLQYVQKLKPVWFDFFFSKVMQFSGYSSWSPLEMTWISYDTPLEVCWAHHHGCHGSHQIWALPVVPLNAVVANHIGWAGVIYAIQVGWTASLKPPTCRGDVSESSREKSKLIEFKLMKCNTQMQSCESAVTLYWRTEKMKCTSGHLQEPG